jgi:transcriptional regulator with XRE-family HTH domain
VEKTPLLPLPSPGERVKLRESMGLSFEKAAQEIGVSARSVWRWEHGKDNMTPDNHRAYQKALKRWKEIIENYR